jgi:hypothetical protein
MGAPVELLGCSKAVATKVRNLLTKFEKGQRSHAGNSYQHRRAWRARWTALIDGVPTIDSEL